jgi:hypothetical protein
VCTDGIVLGVDLEYTEGDSTMPGQKMFWLPRTPDPNYFVLMAASGNSDMTRAFMENLESRLPPQIGVGEVGWKELRRYVRRSLRAIWIRHIDPIPANEREGFKFYVLFALRVGNQTRLYRNNRTVLVEIEHGTYCNGIGLYSARCLADVLLGWWPHISVDSAAQVAAFIVHKTKEHIRDVGKGSDIHILPRSGLAYSLLASECRQVETEFSALISALQTCIAHISGDDYLYFQKGSIEAVSGALSKLGENQNRRRDARINRSREIRSR